MDEGGGSCCGVFIFKGVKGRYHVVSLSSSFWGVCNTTWSIGWQKSWGQTMVLQGASFHFSTMKYQANTPRIPSCFTLNKNWLYTVGTTFVSLVGSYHVRSIYYISNYSWLTSSSNNPLWETTEMLSPKWTLKRLMCTSHAVTQKAWPSWKLLLGSWGEEFMK